MKKIILSFLILFGFGITQAQTPLFTENFSYVAGELLTAHNWLQSGTTATNAVASVAPGLTYSKYPSVAGNACGLITSGQDVYQTYTAVSTNSIYLSFLLNVSAAQTGDYFIALSPTNYVSSSGAVSSGQTNYYTRTFIKSSGAGYSLGVSKYNEAAAYGSTVLDFNKTYVVVIKYTFKAGTTADDEVSLFLLKDPDLPASEPAKPEVGPSTGDAAKLDAVDLSFVTLRQGTASSAPTLTIDGIRIATNWGVAVTGTASAIDVHGMVIPDSFELYQNYPNPFNPTTNISYSLPKQSDVEITIHDVTGSEVKSYSMTSQSTGMHTIQWDGTNNSGSQVTSGVYIYSVKVKSVDDGQVFQKSAKLTLMR